jgi:hypothetical protein
MVLALTIPTGSAGEIHECLKAGGQVVRPIVADVQDLAAMLPLTRAVYVDKDTAAPPALQDGTIAYPFATIQAAATALTATGGVILIAPGQYTEPAITLPAAQISLQALGPKSQGSNANVTLNNSVSGTSDIGASNISFINALSTTARLFVDNCAVTNFSAGTGVSIVQNSQITNTTCTGTLQAYNCTFTNTTTLATVESYDCRWSGLSCTGALTIRNSTTTFAVSVGGNCIVQDTSFGIALTVTGQLVSDYSSLAPILASVTAGSFNLAASPISPKITVSVTVPVVAAGAVGYVDVALGATKLAGLVAAGSLLVANPTADLVAAGAGGGFINVRANGANTARFAFLGPLAGGASNFTLGVI